ncbi:hypothetical protein, partial [Pseudomonas putida]|uniref:hypothetical protein n=1 Tax=Pseudomonas putida TaxID=303 RepID=UPI002B244A6C
LAGVLGIGEGHLLHRKTRRVIPGILSKSGSLLQDFPKYRFLASVVTGKVQQSFFTPINAGL